MEAGDFQHLQVLVIDDHILVLNLTHRLLEKLGIVSVTLARSGSEALQLLESEAGATPHLIISDINMPDMDGAGLMHQLAAHGRRCGRRFAVMLLSGAEQHVLDAMESLARSLGLDVLGSLQKPVKSHALVALLQTLDPARLWPTGLAG